MNTTPTAPANVSNESSSTDDAAKPSGSPVTAPISEADGAQMLADRRAAKAKGEVGEVKEKDTVTPENKAKKIKPKAEEADTGKEEFTESEEEGEADPDGTEDKEEKETDAEDEDGEKGDDEELDDAIEIKVNGKMEKVTLTDLVANYSKGQGFEKKMTELAEKEKTYTRREADLTAKHNDAANHVISLGRQLQEQITKDVRYSKETMDQLRQTDPSEWSARRAELSDKQVSVQRAQALAQHQQQQRAAQEKAQNEQYASEQVKLLKSKIPEFSDPKVMASTLDEVEEYLTSGNFDFSPDEIKGLARSSMWEIAMKAMKYDQAKGNVKDFAKQIRKAPRMLTPGAKQSQSQLTGLEKQLADKRADLKKTGNQKTAVEVLQLQRKIQSQKNKR